MTKNIEKVNILTNFFDMTLEEESSCLPYVRQYFDSSYCEFCMNKLMTKTQALKIIAKEYHHLSDFSRLMISSDAVNSGEIMNFCGEKIFQNIDSWVSGWLFFYDSCTLMNWEHACEYTLVIADNMILKQKHTKAPAEIIALEPI